jgi:hypothetical protein
MVVAVEQEYRTRHGFTWGEIYTFFSELAKIPEENGIGYGAKAVVDSMSSIEQAPIKLQPEHAVTLLAAGCLAHYLELDKKEDRSERDDAIRLCWRATLSMIGRVEMTQIHILTVATQIQAMLKYTLDIPQYARAVLEQVARTIEQHGFADTQKLRVDLLSYITQMQNADHDLEKRQQAIQACCVILSFFH